MNIKLKILFSLIVAIGLLVLGYFLFSQKYFIPLEQKPDYTFLENENLEIDDGNTEIEIDASIDGTMEEQLVVKETDLDYKDIEVPQSEFKNEVVVANYFDELQKPRLMTLSPYGDIIVSDIKAGSVYAVIDDDKDYRADRKIEIISGLNNPHGLAFNNNDLYIAQTDQVMVLKNLSSDYKYTSNNKIIQNLTNSSGHFTRTIQIIDNKLYISVGSSCNVCLEDNSNRAKILRFDLDGSNKEIFASGLRNSVGFVTSPFDNKIYATENSRDWLGNNLPPDEINIIEQNSNYGWPNCYANQIHDSDYDKNIYIKNPCDNTKAPIWELGAHVAPLGLRFYKGEMFPEYMGDLLVAQHGSWNSTVPVGYKVTRIDFDENNNPKEELDLIDIFLQGDKVKGRPVDVLVGNKGEIYVTDDYAGRIYVMYKQ